MRGHESETEALPDVDWGRLAGVRGAITIFVSTRQLTEFVGHLVKGGRPTDETAVLISGGTTPEQQTVTGTLGDIEARARDAGIRFPAMLLIGAVVGLREHLRWFDDRPLFGKRIVITRSREQASELVRRLEDLGAEPIVAPSIRIAPLESFEALDRAAAEVGGFDWVVFTSANGVDHFMARLLAGAGDVRDLKGVRVCTIGPSTAARVERYGIKVDLTPPEYRAEAVIEALKARTPLAGLKFLLPRADIAREVLPTGLRAEGAEVVGGGRLPDRAGRDGGRARRLPDAARPTGGRDHVHQRLDGAELREDHRPRAGRRPAADDGGGLHRAGDVRGGQAAEHPAAASCRRPTPSPPSWTPWWSTSGARDVRGHPS